MRFSYGEGVAWFRLASAALVFTLWTKPWRTFRAANRETLTLLLLGAYLALMNRCALV